MNVYTGEKSSGEVLRGGEAKEMKEVKQATVRGTDLAEELLNGIVERA